MIGEGILKFVLIMQDPSIDLTLAKFQTNHFPILTPSTFSNSSFKINNSNYNKFLTQYLHSQSSISPSLTALTAACHRHQLHFRFLSAIVSHLLQPHGPRRCLPSPLASRPSQLPATNRISGETDEDKKLNATYIISVARKLGCSIFLLPEDIIEVNQKMILTLTASIMYWSLQQKAEDSESTTPTEDKKAPEGDKQ